ncbi:helix-turn-helix domain-containing protein [Photobacterium damselae]|uniref:helix-turn-helix domain-containing protein n=1 Tax=Photobacterium damselae TaxID=38293 RepID=UPI003709C60B
MSLHTKTPLERMISLRKALEKDNTLSSTQRHLFTTLFLFADEKGKCRPDYDAIRDVSGLSRATIAKGIKVLVEHEWIVYEKGSGSRCQSNCYQISDKKLCGYTLPNKETPKLRLVS